ncbi:MAG: hypothetical protein HGA96_12500 [Desulfobulbaceae bacterium]|nr:hypothetical protein [Desulfobulbaceae bacterium]
MAKDMDMENMVKELRKMVKFKETTDVGDLVLVVMETPLSCLYALVRAFERDQNKRDEWWKISLHLLSLPPQEISWILRTEQFTGKEIFTMGGDKRFMQAVDLGPLPLPEDDENDNDDDNLDDNLTVKSKRPVLRLVK